MTQVENFLKINKRGGGRLLETSEYMFSTANRLPLLSLAYSKYVSTKIINFTEINNYGEEIIVL